MSFFGARPAAALEPKDIEVPNLPSDSTSQLAFSPTADLLAVASWSNEVRIYEVNPQGQAIGKAAYSHEAPALSVQWSKDGTKVISGGADKAARMMDLATGQTQQVAQHDEPIKCVKYFEANGQGMLGGDRIMGQGEALLNLPAEQEALTLPRSQSLKYWDLRTPNPVATVQLPERCYTLDVVYPLMVVGTAERQIQIFNLNQPTQAFKTLTSPLRWQTRVISCFPDATGYAVGTIEGRVAIQHIDDKAASSNFTFKCHRKDDPAPSKSSTVYAVNDISFHPYGTFSTAGSDGTINFWDKESKTRLKTFENKGGPIVSTSFNHTGRIFAYAVTQDWSGGHTKHKPDFVNQVMLHPCKDEEVKKRAKK
ncbi:SPOSA6832_03312 [Sporobolomyces salmonicolor]|uniref:SPOSA6832_03312-mRNA-1:cds n=1 Tax=Sporidiobolus salmonicolor TaxID=5005 RepID=A0A0D6EPQ2_SPOSA|nr:SPOSA6832_03312 [Sporobolomyces salmonicolor]